MRSARSKAIVNAFGQLGGFYGSDAELSRAVGISEESIRVWKRKLPLRPRISTGKQIMRLWRLCLEAAPYMRSPDDVGRWTLTPSPRLDGYAPAQLLLERESEGLSHLMEELADLTPLQTPDKIELPTGDDLRNALIEGIGADAMSEVDRMMAAAETSSDRRSAEVTLT